jgi:hypothetical protein
MRPTLLLVALLVGVTAHAAQRAPAPVPTVRAEDAPAAPLLSQDVGWVRPVLIGVGVLFAAALLLGPIYRLNLPADLTTHSHDEPPGASHHHGPGGTADFSAPDRR